MTQNVVCYVLSPNDNCATMLHDVEPSQNVRMTGAVSGKIMSAEVIPCGFKIALTEFKSGDTIIKNGCPIGIATKRIIAGEMIHINNICSMCESEQNES